MHKAAFAALKLDWRYDLLPIRPGEIEQELPALVEQGYRGFNVTVPHKSAILSASGLIERDEAVNEIGACNVITVQEDGRLIATNSDWRGFTADLGAHSIDVKGARCLILGSGGSAQAVAYALHRMEAGSIKFVSRRAVENRPAIICYKQLADEAPGAKLIVNCTPVGMWPEVDASPWPKEIPIPSGAMLYDLVYNPPRTALMAQAAAAGAQEIGGLGMLVEQGALAFELWTGRKPPIDIMREAAQQSLTQAG